MNTDITQLKAYKQMPTTSSTDIQWLSWMKLLDGTYGRNVATSMFLKLWEKRGSSKANTIALRKELKDKYNIEIDESVWNKFADLGGGIADTFSGIFRVGKITFYVVGGVVLLAVVGAIISVIKNPSKLALATPQGRALKAAGGANR